MLVNAFWRPQSELCQPCAVRYNFVGHYETLNDDAYLVLETIGMRGVRFPVKDDKTTTSVTPRFISKLMSALSIYDLSRLREFYRADWELFNFTVNKYVVI
jgi:dermatan 4-sulfotransferase 1